MNILYFLLVEHRDEKGREELDSVLSDPSSGHARRDRAAIATLVGGKVIEQRS